MSKIKKQHGLLAYANRLIESRRQKGRHNTGTLIRVGITPAICGLVEKYAADGSCYLFPILPVDRALGHEEYKALLRAYNHSLKEIGSSLTTPVRLTSYTMKYSKNISS